MMEELHEPITVYRGLKLTEEQIKKYDQSKMGYFTWPGFTSTSKCKKFAMRFCSPIGVHGKKVIFNVNSLISEKWLNQSIDDSRRLFKMLRYRTIDIINISRVNEKVIKAFAEILPTITVRVITIMRCEINSAIKDLAQGLKKCKVTMLEFNSSQMENGFGEFFQILPNHKSIRFLSFINNQIKDEEVIQLIKVLPETNVIGLYIYLNENVTDIAANFVADNFYKTKLKSLDFRANREDPSIVEKLTKMVQEQRLMVASVEDATPEEIEENGLDASHDIKKVVYKCGDIYIGSWANGKKERKGVMYSFSGGMLSGHFADDKVEGYGECRNANGNVYQGEYKRGCRNGPAVCTYADGSKFIGAYDNGSRSGYCIMYYSNGDKFEGLYVNGNQEGYGTFFSANGARYWGFWKDGKRCGKGEEWTSADQKYIGEFENNKRNGEGFITDSNERRFRTIHRDGALLFKELI